MADTMAALLNDDLLTEAWERCGLSPAILTGDAWRSARRSLQLMLVDWSNREVPLWQIDRQTVALTAGTVSLALPAGTADVLEAWVTDSDGTRLDMTALGRDEWTMQSGRLTSGRPTSYWVERLRSGPVLHLWPAPARDYTLGYNRFRLPEDVGGPLDTPDAPILWSEAVAAGLAVRLAVKFAPPRVTLLQQMADAAWNSAAGEDRERVPFTAMPMIY